MRFLCFHGMGTNAKIFENQTERMRQALGREHEFVFVAGTIPTDPAPGVNTTIDGSYRFFSVDLVQMKVIYQNLVNFIIQRGPFDGVMGYSEGGLLAATLLVHDAQQPFAGFRCGIFFCAATPMHLDVLKTGVRRELSLPIDGVVVNVPTAHIWSPNGKVHKAMGQGLVPLCNEGMREEVVHSLGHNIPGATSEEGLVGALRAIERTIERART